jgi:hypothetical protein
MGFLDRVATSACRCDYCYFLGYAIPHACAHVVATSCSSFIYWWLCRHGRDGFTGDSCCSKKLNVAVNVIRKFHVLETRSEHPRWCLTYLEPTFNKEACKLVGIFSVLRMDCGSASPLAVAHDLVEGFAQSSLPPVNAKQDSPASQTRFALHGWQSPPLPSPISKADPQETDNRANKIESWDSKILGSG